MTVYVMRNGELVEKGTTIPPQLLSFFPRRC